MIERSAEGAALFRPTPINPMYALTHLPDRLGWIGLLRLRADRCKQ
jgi:hypothetical protein